MAKVDADGVVGPGARFGYVLYSWRAQVKSLVTEDASKLNTVIDNTAWPTGGTMTHRALYKALQVLRLAGGDKSRLQVAMLITDGRATKRAHAIQAAKHVRKSGVRVFVVPVKGALRNKADMCQMASDPCEWNMINTPRFTDLRRNMLLYLTNLCPTVADPDDPIAR